MTVYVVEKATGRNNHIFKDVVSFDCHRSDNYDLWFSNDEEKRCDRFETIKVNPETEWVSIYC